MSYSFQKLKPFIFLLCCWAVLFALNIIFSRDIFQYHCWFDDALALAGPDRFFGLKGYFHDPAYYILQAVGTMLFPFEIFFWLLIFAALLVKLLALLRVTPNPSLLDVLPYLMVLSFLHEGTQIRVALALSIALWALIKFAQGKRHLAIFILGVACTFHISVACFFHVFLMLFLYERFGKIVLIIIAVVATIIAYTSIVRDLVMQFGELTNARYMAYSVGSIYRKQNSSGLFQYFSLFVGGLTILVWKLYQPESKAWAQLKKIALASGFLAIIILQIFRFNVVIASRLADLLLLPIVLVFGSALVQLQKSQRKNLLRLLIFALISYGAARGFLTYAPSNAPRVCHPELLPNYHPEND